MHLNIINLRRVVTLITTLEAAFNIRSFITKESKNFDIIVINSLFIYDLVVIFCSKIQFSFVSSHLIVLSSEMVFEEQSLLWKH